MMKSISIWAFSPDRAWPEAFTMAKSAGFEAVEVAIAAEGPLTPNSTREECQRVVAQAQEAGLQVSSLASGMGWKHQLTTSDAAERRESIDVTAKSLQIARWLGVDALLCVPGAVDAKTTSYDEAYDNALAALRELAPVAQETGVTIGVENVWNKFLLSPLEMRDFLDAVGAPRVGCYFDVGNVLLTGYPQQWISILQHRISRIHFKDFKTSVGTFDGFCPLLEGDVDFPAVKNALRKVGYQGSVTAEFFECEADIETISVAMDKIAAM
ncbi:MAG: sugar phosphate isomerase/epimerase [Armatimonadetes bacterium]|nr:sugar phosphate isomerase/epimerase [Armatimonadota bacterium]